MATTVKCKCGYTHILETGKIIEAHLRTKKCIGCGATIKFTSEGEDEGVNEDVAPERQTESNPAPVKKQRKSKPKKG